jgi:hypothetical protein
MKRLPSALDNIHIPIYSTDNEEDVEARVRAAERIFLSARCSGCSEEDSLDAVRHAGFHRD